MHNDRVYCGPGLAYNILFHGYSTKNLPSVIVTTLFSASDEINIEHDSCDEEGIMINMK